MSTQSLFASTCPDVLPAVQLCAVEHIKRVRGGSQAHILRCSDGNEYVTKFQNNPQDLKVLANELLGTRLGQKLGLPMAVVQVIEVGERLIESTPDLRIEIAGHSIPCKSGVQVGSRVPSDAEQLSDFLVPDSLRRISNVADFPRSIVFDKWTCNADGRQAVFFRRDRGPYHATFIDQGYCFNAGEWSFPDLALHGIYYKNTVYESVAGWESFEPVLTRAEGMSIDEIWECASGIPTEWYGARHDRLCELVETLFRRRSNIRDLISAFRESSRVPFPAWK